MKKSSLASASPAAGPQTTPAKYPHCSTEAREVRLNLLLASGQWTSGRDEWDLGVDHVSSGGTAGTTHGSWGACQVSGAVGVT